MTNFWGVYGVSPKEYYSAESHIYHLYRPIRGLTCVSIYKGADPSGPARTPLYWKNFWKVPFKKISVGYTGDPRKPPPKDPIGGGGNEGPYRAY